VATQITKRLKRFACIISRELDRNTQDGYCASLLVLQQAQNLGDERIV